jgi:hypothetical protein
MNSAPAPTPSDDVKKVVAHVKKTIRDLDVPSTDVAYEYAALPLCVIDAVFSIGVRYETVQKVVKGWCERNGWESARGKASRERTVSEFLALLQPYENRWEEMAVEVFQNRQRTSSRSGILKAEAVYRFAKALQKFQVETFADALAQGLHRDVRSAIRAIPGQGTGISYSYFLILAGNPDAVKADRMVLRFIADALGTKDVSQEAAQELVRQAASVLRSEFPRLTASLLDNKIWNFQRG